eukprot:14492689-Alexandrium_andersonii.AAC.1
MVPGGGHRDEPLTRDDPLMPTECRCYSSKAEVAARSRQRHPKKEEGLHRGPVHGWIPPSAETVGAGGGGPALAL